MRKVGTRSAFVRCGYQESWEKGVPICRLRMEPEVRKMDQPFGKRENRAMRLD
jgi:hypothetical protein